MWVSSIISYTCALLLNYQLYYSDYLGLSALTLVTAVSVLKKEWLLPSLFILLVFGMLNLVSFVYFINIVVHFGFFHKIYTPGIQFFSLILFFVLILFRRRIIIKQFANWFDLSDKNTESSDNRKHYFLSRFEKLTLEEINKKLETPLVPEAIQALKELKEIKQASVEQEKSHE